MTISNENDSLFAELRALALRYGEEKVDTTWKCVQEKIAETKKIPPSVVTLPIHNGDCVEAFLALFAQTLAPLPHHNQKYSLEFTGKPPAESVMDHIAATLLAYRASNLDSSLAPQSGKIIFPGNQRAYTHLIEKGGSGLMDSFKSVVLLGDSNFGFSEPNTFPLIDQVLLWHIKERVLENRFAKSLELQWCRISMTEAILLQSILESDRLKDLKMSCMRVTPGEEPYVSASLIRGFRGPLFASTQRRNLQNLQRLTLEGGFLESLDSTMVGPLFSAITTIESLHELTVGLKQTSILNALSECTFKALRKLSFSWDNPSRLLPSFDGLFELVARSKELRSFGFEVHVNAEVDSSVTELLFDLAFESGGSSLLEIQLAGNFPFVDLSEWDLDDDGDVQLRRFELSICEESLFEYRGNARLARNLTTLLDLLKTRFCYLFDLGLYEDEVDDFEWLIGDHAARIIFDQIKLQLERNRVGARLLTLRPGSPRGLWPIILERPANEKNLKDVPWTGMYEIVQSLLTARDSVDDKTDDAVACDDDRRKRQRML